MILEPREEWKDDVDNNEEAKVSKEISKSLLQKLFEKNYTPKKIIKSKLIDINKSTIYDSYNKF